MNSENNNQTLVDENQNVFCIKEEMSRGGQGVVYRLTDKNLAAKISLKKINPAKLRQLRYLPLPPELPITMPRSILSGGISGYIMTLLEGMKSLGGFRKLDPPKTGWNAPAHLQELGREIAWEYARYAQTGGIRKRLEILANAASSMTRLHAAGMCYGDISANNVFYTEGHDKVWWIDPDNIRYDKEGNVSAMCTPGFGAPEIIRQESPNSCAGDVFSMAVLAHILLTDLFPFDGAMVQEGAGWDDDDATGEENSQERMYRGELPWIFDENDTSNERDALFPPVLVLGPDLSGVLGEIFGQGRLNPEARPTMMKLAHTLCESWMDTVQCPNPECQMSNFSRNMENGPDAPLTCCYCGATVRRYLTLSSYVYTMEGEQKKLGRMVREIIDGQILHVPHCLLHPYSLEHYAEPQIEIRLSGAELRLQFNTEAAGNWEMRGADRQNIKLTSLQNSFNINDLSERMILFYKEEGAPIVKLDLNWTLL